MRDDGSVPDVLAALAGLVAWYRDAVRAGLRDDEERKGR